MEYNTQILKVNANKKNLREDNALLKAAELIKEGEVVAFPTETVYGLGADASRGEAVKKIFLAKGRPQDNPLIVHIASKETIYSLTDLPPGKTAEKLIDAFWPGPLTIIINKNSVIPEVTTGGLDSVAVRFPSHPVARTLIELTNLPLAAPSANQSGAPSPTLAKHVYQDLKGRIPLIIDGGSSWVGVESTVVDVREEVPVILRPGGVTREEIEKILKMQVKVAPKLLKPEDKPLSPGMKYRHYSPETPVFLFNRTNLDNILAESKSSLESIALVVTDETYEDLDELPDNIVPVKMGALARMEDIAASLFALLRRLDDEDFSRILIEKIPEKGMGSAIMNRLYKASNGNIF